MKCWVRMCLCIGFLFLSVSDSQATCKYALFQLYGYCAVASKTAIRCYQTNQKIKKMKQMQQDESCMVLAIAFATGFTLPTHLLKNRVRFEN